MRKYREFAEWLRVLDYNKIVFTNGCFDIFHEGHAQLLRFCWKLAGEGGAVIVGLNDDDSIRRLKGPERPIFSVGARNFVLMSSRYVSHVVTFSEDTPIDLINALRPDVIVKSSQYDEKDVVGCDTTKIVLAPHVPNVSTTEIINKIRGFKE